MELVLSLQSGCGQKTLRVLQHSNIWSVQFSETVTVPVSKFIARKCIVETVID
jgi:hypothetical protein